MSKLGVHISAGNRTGFGPFLQRCAVSGSPVAVVLSVDQDIYPDISQLSPLTTLVFRCKVDNDDNPPTLYQYKTSPEIEARDWYQQCKVKWDLNRAHYYAPLNEPNPAGQDQCKWLSAFMIRMCELAEQDGLRLAMFGASAGTPDYSDWRYLQPAMQRMQRGGHILLLHEYGLDRGTLNSSAPDLALRYREVKLLLGDDCPNIIIGECSGGSGYDASGKHSTQWLDDVKWYDSELMRDSYVIGACLYQLGGAENIVKILPQIGEYISTHPTIEPPEPTDQTVEQRLAALELQTSDLEHRVTVLETRVVSA